jgi:hypothetical protein
MYLELDAASLNFAFLDDGVGKVVACVPGYLFTKAKPRAMSARALRRNVLRNSQTATADGAVMLIRHRAMAYLLAPMMTIFPLENRSAVALLVPLERIMHAAKRFGLYCVFFADFEIFSRSILSAKWAVATMFLLYSERG